MINLLRNQVPVQAVIVQMMICATCQVVSVFARLMYKVDSVTCVLRVPMGLHH